MRLVKGTPWFKWDKDLGRKILETLWPGSRKTAPKWWSDKIVAREISSQFDIKLTHQFVKRWRYDSDRKLPRKNRGSYKVGSMDGLNDYYKKQERVRMKIAELVKARGNVK